MVRYENRRTFAVSKEKRHIVKIRFLVRVNILVRFLGFIS